MGRVFFSGEGGSKSQVAMAMSLREGNAMFRLRGLPTFAAAKEEVRRFGVERWCPYVCGICPSGEEPLTGETMPEWRDEAPLNRPPFP